MVFNKLQTTGTKSETFENLILKKIENEIEIMKMIIIIFNFYLINKTN